MVYYIYRKYPINQIKREEIKMYQIKEFLELCIVIGLVVFFWEVIALALNKAKEKAINLLMGSKK